MKTNPDCSAVLDYRDATRNDEPIARMAGLSLEFVTRMVAAPLALILVYGEASHLGLIVAKSDSILDTDSEVVGSEYLASLVDEDPILHVGMKAGKISLVGTERLMESPGFNESAFATSFLAGNDLGPILALHLGGGDETPSCILILMRRDDESDFSDREKSFLRHAAPVLAQSLRSAAAAGPEVHANGKEWTNDVETLLTPRELEIAWMAVRGAHNDEIGEKLHISTGTVKTHLRNIYSKLDVDSRIHLSMRLAGP